MFEHKDVTLDAFAKFDVHNSAMGRREDANKAEIKELLQNAKAQIELLEDAKLNYTTRDFIFEVAKPTGV
jgi:hypothetical protein